MNIGFWHVQVKVLLKFLCYVLDTSDPFSAYLPVSLPVCLSAWNNLIIEVSFLIEVLL